MTTGFVATAMRAWEQTRGRGVTPGMNILIPILGDQLSMSIASLGGMERGNCTILMVEVRAEATYVRHHKKKIALIFSAMRHFA